MTPIPEQLAALTPEDRAKVGRAVERMVAAMPQFATFTEIDVTRDALAALRAVGAIAPEREAWEMAFREWLKKFEDRPPGLIETFRDGFEAGKAAK